jgi:lipoprotein signal peptidase
VNSWAILAPTAIAVLAVDQAVKLLVHRVETLRVIEGQLWVRRASDRHSNMLWLWVVPAAVLVIVTAWIPSSGIFVGLLLGGSLSNAVEGSLRGSVTDYISVRFWPAFNIADIGITVGAIGIAIELLRTAGGVAG